MNDGVKREGLTHPVQTWDPDRPWQHPAWRLGNVLDVRSQAAYRRVHLAPAVNIPLNGMTGVAESRDAEALERDLPSVFLPPHHEPLLVVAERMSLAAALCDCLRERGRPAVEPCAPGPGDWERIPARALAHGTGRGHLWRPPAFLRAHAHLLPPPPAGPVVDLGSGSCRATVWLAERGYQTTAVDHQESTLALGRRLASSRQVECRFLVRDLRDPGQIPPGPWAAVLIFRYLERSLLRRLSELLPADGVAMVRTFRYVPGRKDLPARKHCLEAGDLLDLLPPADFRILVHQEDYDGDGLPAAGIIARRMD
jgi:rhodanese-related sulfurtransferase